jgi:hypothetical protein
MLMSGNGGGVFRDAVIFTIVRLLFAAGCGVGVLLGGVLPPPEGLYIVVGGIMPSTPSFPI